MKASSKKSDLPTLPKENANASAKHAHQSKSDHSKLEKAPESMANDALDKKKRRPILNPESKNQSAQAQQASELSSAVSLSSVSRLSGTRSGARSATGSNRELDGQNRKVRRALNMKTEVNIYNSSSQNISSYPNQGTRGSATGIDLTHPNGAARLSVDRGSGRRPSLSPQDALGFDDHGINHGWRRSIEISDTPNEKDGGSMIKEPRKSLPYASEPYNLGNILSRHSVGIPITESYRSISDIQNKEIHKSTAIDERSISDRKRQEMLKKEADDIIKKPSRQLPSDIMEKYKIRASKLDSTDHTDLTSKQEERSESKSLQASSDVLEDTAPQIKVINKYRKLWNLAICHTLVGIRFNNLYEELRAKSMNIQRAKALEAEGLSVLLSSNISKGDPAVSARIQEITNKHDRSEEDVEALERILSIKNRAFGRFSIDQRLKFCRILKYENYKGERMIVKEGHTSWAFYFILSGQVEIFKVKDNLKYRLNVIGAGASFGDRTMNMLNDKRTASVASTVDVELLKIDKADFFDITNVRDEKSMASRSAKILQIPHFSTAPGGFVERITPFTQVITYEPNEYILREGTENNKIFWLVKGSCQCIKMLPFVKKTLSESYAGKKVKVIPLEEGKTKLEKDDEFMYEFATIYEIEPGFNFPDIPVPTGSSLTNEVFYVNKKEYCEQLAKEDPSDMNSKSAVSIVAKTKVEVICVNRSDYTSLASTDMILSIMNSKSIYRIPISQLQESYLEGRKWNQYKKKVMSDVVSKNK